MQNNKYRFIRSVAIGGYRSFGSELQRFEKFNKINLFIGQNNCGKSNILRFFKDIYPHLIEFEVIKFDQLDRHIPSGAPFTYGLSVSLGRDESGNYQALIDEFKGRISDTSIIGTALKLFLAKSKQDGTDDVWFSYKPKERKRTIVEEEWRQPFRELDDYELERLWAALTAQRGGSRDAHWEPETLSALSPDIKSIKTILIPAIRQIGKKGSVSEEFSGEGIIERLVKLQNPDVHNQEDRKKFHKINEFLKNVTDNKSASIEIPHDRDMILVHMDQKTLPLSSLGTGIHEVIILASAATILDNCIICIEEPELHLNPLLQKKFIRYLDRNTSNQYFITTHSASLMDTPNAEVYHIQLIDGESVVDRVTSDSRRSSVCEDLGYHPSDLLQANCIIWVEGPSDRIYLNYWINYVAPQYIEGTHYSIMFYGGKLASHLSGVDMDGMLDDFISLRRLNRRAVIVIDSDRSKKGGKINNTKIRLRNEFDSGPGFCWITQGKEIENYLPKEQIQFAIKIINPAATLSTNNGQYDNVLSIKTKNRKFTQSNKVKIARLICKEFKPNLMCLDLQKQLQRIIAFIGESNIC